MSEALKLCPYCGGEAVTDKYVVTKEVRKWGAYCRDRKCKVTPYTEMYNTEAEAIKAWNTRPGEQAAYEAGMQAGRAAERERVVGRLNEQITNYIKDKRLGFEAALCYKEATECAIVIVREEGEG